MTTSIRSSKTATIATTPTQSPRTLSELASLVSDYAARPQEWIDRVRLRVGERWYERLERSDTHEVWAISWMPGQGTGFHDHGGSAGAFAVAFGTLEEHRPTARPLSVNPGQVRAFGPHDVHDVRNASAAPAVSIHPYSPPLSIMNRYDLDDAGLIPRGTVFEDAELDQRRQDEVERATPPTSGRRSIDDVLRAARARLQRVSPEQAYSAIDAGGVIVDIRPAAQRVQEGEIPGALIVERNVLEWRFDPASDARLAAATGYDLHLIVVCSEGYTSSLAAAALQDLGLIRATDIIGGFHAWRAAGLPWSRTG
jgi:rhodanese-related sulfurtransferase/predicted metal-dependent enzyme (double-stranded beta helix superfamily)